MANVTSPGHKLGQLIGNFFEEFFSNRLENLAEELGVYCDRKGLRPDVRHGKREVIWADSEGNKHRLDYVFEKNGAKDKKGEPAAFIELAWRRYTKHSRNKAGEIEAALVPLGNTYRSTCNFLGAVLAGEYTEGALRQLRSKNINILYIPYNKVIEAFLTKGIDLDYPERSSADLKYSLIEAWENLKSSEIEDISETFVDLIRSDYDEFAQSIRKALSRKIERIRIIPLFGDEMVFASASNAIIAIERFDMVHTGKESFYKFEIFISFTNGSKIECSFCESKETLEFLEMYNDPS